MVHGDKSATNIFRSPAFFVIYFLSSLVAVSSLFIGTVLLWAAVSTSWAVPVNVSLNPSATDIYVGDTFSVDIIADISDPILGWGLDFNFDNSFLNQVGGPAIGAGWLPAASLDGDGLAGITFPSTSGNNILLATLTFEAVGAGATSVFADYTAFDLTEGFALAFPAPPGSFALVNFSDLVINIGEAVSVPEPGTFILMGLGLFLISLQKRHNQMACLYNVRPYVNPLHQWIPANAVNSET